MTSKMDHTGEPDVSPNLRTDAERPAFEEDEVQAQWRRVVGRRSFLKGVGLAGAAVVPGGALFAAEAIARSSAITDGDVAILRFLAAAELIESDLWQQYNELGGVNGGNPAYMAALSNLDGDMPQYIADNTDDEESHAAFLNAYLQSKGAQPVNLDAFRTLPSSQATGAQADRPADEPAGAQRRHELVLALPQRPRTPTSGRRFPQAVTIKNEPAIPLNDTDTPPGTAQPGPAGRAAALGGCRRSRTRRGFTSRRSSRAARASTARWRSRRPASRSCGSSSASAESRPTTSRSGTTRPATPWRSRSPGSSTPRPALTFPDLNAKGGELNQTNLILPEPTPVHQQGPARRARSCVPPSTRTPARSRRSTASPRTSCSRASQPGSSAPSWSWHGQPTPPQRQVSGH